MAHEDHSLLLFYVLASNKFKLFFFLQYFSLLMRFVLPPPLMTSSWSSHSSRQPFDRNMLILKLSKFANFSALECDAWIWKMFNLKINQPQKSLTINSTFLKSNKSFFLRFIITTLETCFSFSTHPLLYWRLFMNIRWWWVYLLLDDVFDLL